MPGSVDLIEAFRAQSHNCGKLGSPFMAALLSEAAGEIGRAGSISGLLAAWPGDPMADAVPLRLAVALHALVLSDAASELAALYPGVVQDAKAAAIWPTALSAIEANRSFVEGFLASPPQTNEVGRSAVLLGGFLETARATDGKPMRLLEVGASAGLASSGTSIATTLARRGTGVIQVPPSPCGPSGPPHRRRWAHRSRSPGGRRRTARRLTLKMQRPGFACAPTCGRTNRPAWRC